MRISKYAFNSKEQAQSKIDALGTTQSSIVQLGNIVLEQGEYDENGEETTAPVLSDKWHLDVLWDDAEITEDEEIEVLDEDGNTSIQEVILVDHPYGWKSYAIDIEGDGVHSFFGLDYEHLKL